MTQVRRLPGRATSGAKKHTGPLGIGLYTHIYAVAGGDLIKFGRASDVQRRLHSLQSGSPVKLTLIGSAFTLIEFELLIHQYLTPDWSHGEWFFGNDEPKLIARLLTGDRQIDLAIRLRQYRHLPQRVVDELNFRAAMGQREQPDLPEQPREYREAFGLTIQESLERNRRLRLKWQTEGRE